MIEKKTFQDRFSIRGGLAVFHLEWGGLLCSEDKAVIFEWLKLVERRLTRLPDVGPLELESSE